MRRRNLVRCGWALGLFAAGCSADIPNGVFACEEDTDCPDDFACLTVSAGLRCVEVDKKHPLGCGDLAPRKYTDTPLWTTADVTECRQSCPDLEASCAEDCGTRGKQFADCLRNARQHCLFDPDGPCRADWTAYACCTQGFCADITDSDDFSSCSDQYCSSELSGPVTCLSSDTRCEKDAWDQCAALARTSANDAGSSDAGVRDAGSSDAGMRDAGSSDAGVRDAGSSDAGVRSDAGASDAAADSGLSDGSPPIKDGGGPGRLIDASADKPMAAALIRSLYIQLR